MSFMRRTAHANGTKTRFWRTNLVLKVYLPTYFLKLFVIEPQNSDDEEEAGKAEQHARF